jgi:hypothetical protein
MKLTIPPKIYLAYYKDVENQNPIAYIRIHIMSNGNSITKFTANITKRFIIKYKDLPILNILFHILSKI